MKRIIFSLLLVAGCGQQAAQVNDQPQATSTRQDTAAQGNTHVNLYNGPVPGGGSQQVFIPGPNGEMVAATIQSSGTAAPNGTSTAGQNATYSMVAYVNTTSGGTSATPTASNTGGAMTQSGTMTPTQTITPETSAAIPIAVGPNSSQNANAVGRGTGTATKEDQLTQTVQQLKAENDVLMEMLKALMTKPATATQPATLPMTPVN